MRGPARPVTLARHYLRWLVALYGALLLMAVGIAMVFVMWPMGQRAAEDLAGIMHLAAQTWVELPPDTRPAFEEELLRSHRLAIRPDMPPTPDTGLRHGFYIRFLEQALEHRQHRVVFLEPREGPDAGRWLWTTLDIGGRGIGVGFDPARLSTRPLTALAAMLLAGSLLLGAAAFWLARRIAEPVKRLERAAAEVAAGAEPQLLPEAGPLELARLAGHFNQMALRVRELLQARTTLLAGVSHDLRTPLARMRLALEMLRLRPDPKLIDRLEQDVEAMNALIGQMLELARGLGPEAPQALELAPWLLAHAERLEPTARERGARITVNCPDGLGIHAAPDLLGRVVDNLLGNAVRHAPGPIELRATTDATGNVSIEVADRGPGIPEDQLEAAWRPFQRVEASRSPETGGFGLGLAIVRQLARSQGWDVRLRHRPGGGLLATVDLPAVPRARGDSSTLAR